VTHDYLFVVTYGRSGSTLLAGILNSIPGYLIRGENKGYLHGLYEAHAGAVARQQSFASKRPLTTENPWYGIDGYDGDAALRHMKELMLDAVLRPSPGTRVVGFKEIRYNQTDLTQYLQFMRSVFPGARFVFNSRNHVDVLRSKWWADKKPATLAKYQQRLDDAEQAHAEVSFHVHYDDYQANPENLRGLFDFLGEDLDVERVAAVLARNHSY